jgi:hypothetical protein
VATGFAWKMYSKLSLRGPSIVTNNKRTRTQTERDTLLASNVATNEQEAFVKRKFKRQYCQFTWSGQVPNQHGPLNTAT